MAKRCGPRGCDKPRSRFWKKQLGVDWFDHNTMVSASPPVNTVLPAISGTTVEEETLSVSTGTWTGKATITFEYQWLRNGLSILGSTTNTYLLVAADAGTNISCTVTGINSDGGVSATSSSVGPITGIPINTVIPVITGTPTVGQTLTSSTGTWSNTPTSYSYQWKRNGVNISSATNSTYMLVSADSQTDITCDVTAINSAGSTTATSNSVTIDQLTPSAFGADAIFYLDPARSESLYQEISASFNASNAVGVPLNKADTDNDLVGLIYDLGNNAMYMTHTTSSATRPTLKSDGSRSSYFDFAGSQGLILQNSTIVLRPAHQVSSSTTWEIAIWAKKSVDGSAMTLYTSSDGATNQRGIYLSTTSGNVINARLGDGDGSLMVNITSSASWVVADGWTVIRFWRNGATCGIQIGNNTAQTAAVSGGVTNNASQDFRLGSSSAGNGFNGGIAQVLMMNRVLTSDEITDFKAFNPSRSNARFRVLARRYDFTDITTLYSDASATVPATVNGQVAAITNDKTSNFGPYPLNLQQGTSANQGTHRSNVVNGQSALEFDGSNDFYNVLNSTVRAGAGTWYFIYINQDASLNSNIADANYPAYIASTGENYLPPSPYVAWHFDVGDVNESVSITNIPNSNTITIIACRMYGGIRTIFNYSGESSEITTSVLQFAPIKFGTAANGDASLYHDGYGFIYEFWHGPETDSEVIDHMQELGVQFGL